MGLSDDLNKVYQECSPKGSSKMSAQSAFDDNPFALEEPPDPFGDDPFADGGQEGRKRAAPAKPLVAQVSALHAIELLAEISLHFFAGQQAVLIRIHQIE